MRPTQKLILASSSPRRQYLMHEIGFHFSIEKPEVDEDFPASMPVEQVAKYLALKKAEFFRLKINHEEVVMTADTVVIINGKILNKPQSRAEAISMLSELSGQTHTVMTGVCILSKEKEESFEEITQVTFKELPVSEIEFYIDHFKPFDKAGSYGAQDCLPKGLNPCSPEEVNFLKLLNKLDIIEKTFTNNNIETIAAIERIEGSYFNVMGLPIHKVHAHLKSF
jgi:septum formation protein